MELGSIAASSLRHRFAAGRGISSVESRVQQLERMIQGIDSPTQFPNGLPPLSPDNTGDTTTNAFKTYLTQTGRPGIPETVLSPGKNGVPVPISTQLNLPTTHLGSLAERKQTFQPLIQSLSQKHGVDAQLVTALVQQESGFNPKVTSKAGAQGLTQLMPQTAKSLGVKNPMDPVQNLDGGIRYLKTQLDRFNGNIPLALAAYNAGPGAVSKYNGIPPYKETQQYVRSILTNYLRHQKTG